MRIAILSPNDDLLTVMDNDLPEALSFFDDELHLYLKGSAYTFDFSAYTQHPDSKYCVVGNKVSFRYKGKDYSTNIVKVERSEYVTTCQCLSMLLELTQEESPPFKSPDAKSFVQYINSFGFDSWTLTMGINEVADKSIKCEWEGTDTVLGRLYSLATKFDAELEFVTALDENYRIEKITMNVYREHSDAVQGMGSDRSATIIRYGKGVEGITKTSDISKICTAIRPTGAEGETLEGYSRTEKDEYGNVLYTVYHQDIRAPQARDRFPSNVLSKDKDQRYILKVWSTDIKGQANLYGRALAELKKLSVPDVTYSVDGYVDEANIGDTFTIEDSEYTPIMFIKCRVVEQQISFTEPSNCKTTFDNFQEMKDQRSQNILDRMQKLLEDSKTYQVYITTSDGQFLKYQDESTVLTASVFDGTTDITSSVTSEWYKGDTFLNNSVSYTVTFDSLNHHNAVYRLNAKDSEGKIRGSAEVTITTIEIPEDGRTPYLHLRYSDDGGITFTANHGKTGGKYLGQYSDFSPIDSESPADYTWTLLKGADGIDGVNGADGKDGINGTNGSDAKQVKMVRTQFYLSDSDTELTGGTWDTACPSVPIGKYLWKRQRFVFTDNSVINGNAWCEMSWAEYLQQQGQTLIDALNELDTRVHSELETGQATLHSAITTEYLNEIGEQIAVVRSQIEQNSSQLSLIFENVDTLTDSEKAHYAELQTVYTWFQFSSSGLTLGKVDDPVQLQLINNELRFLQDGTKVAWFSDSQLHVSEAVIENRLIVGNFEILSKGGGLMIRKFK